MHNNSISKQISVNSIGRLAYAYDKLFEYYTRRMQELGDKKSERFQEEILASKRYFEKYPNIIDEVKFFKKLNEFCPSSLNEAIGFINAARNQFSKFAMPLSSSKTISALFEIVEKLTGESCREVILPEKTNIISSVIHGWELSKRSLTESVDSSVYESEGRFVDFIVKEGTERNQEMAGKISFNINPADIFEKTFLLSCEIAQKNQKFFIEVFQPRIEELKSETIQLVEGYRKKIEKSDSQARDHIVSELNEAITSIKEFVFDKICDQNLMGVIKIYRLGKELS